MVVKEAAAKEEVARRDQVSRRLRVMGVSARWDPGGGNWSSVISAVVDTLVLVSRSVVGVFVLVISMK